MAVGALRPAARQLLGVLARAERVQRAVERHDRLLERTACLRRGDLGPDLAFHLLALVPQQALALEARAGAVFLRVRALEEQAQQVLGIAAAHPHLAADAIFLLDALDGALPGGELDRRAAHPQRCGAMVEKARVALLMAIDGARRRAGEAAGVEDAAGLHQRFQERAFLRFGEGVVPLAGPVLRGGCRGRGAGVVGLGRLVLVPGIGLGGGRRDGLAVLGERLVGGIVGHGGLRIAGKNGARTYSRNVPICKSYFWSRRLLGWRWVERGLPPGQPAYCCDRPHAGLEAVLIRDREGRHQGPRRTRGSGARRTSGRGEADPVRFFDKPDTRRLEGAADGLDQLGLDVPVVPLEAKDRAATDPRRLRGFLERPVQRRPRHARLLGTKNGTFQDYSLSSNEDGP